MEILTLRVLITEAEVNTLLARESNRGGPLQEVSIRFTAEGVEVRGRAQMVVGIGFEARWIITVDVGAVIFSLSEVRVAGVAAGGVPALKASLMTLLAHALAAGDALTVDGSSLRVDVDRLLASRGFPARTNLTAVRCEHGRLFIEASATK